MSLVEGLLGFLHERDVDEKQQGLLRQKIRLMSRTGIGRKLGVKEDSRIEDIPITQYPFYKPFYDSPSRDNMLYPLNEYEMMASSGSAGEMKWYMVPKQWIGTAPIDNFIAGAIISTHDGKEMTFREGDTFYAFPPSRPFAMALAWPYMQQKYSSIIKLLPDDPDISYQDKIMRFIRDQETIDIAFISLPLLLHQIYPRLQRRIELKGLVTYGGSVDLLSKEIAEATTARPFTQYGASETGVPCVPSVQHKMGLIFNWSSGYAEFLPAGKATESIGEALNPMDTVPLSEVEVGERYQMIYTSFGVEFMRYLTSDLFDCVAKGDDILGTDLPVFRFVGRVGKNIWLHEFAEIGEEELSRALNAAGIGYIDFTARRELEGSYEYLALYLEPREPTEPQAVARALHESLINTHRTYGALSRMSNYTPVKVEILKPGTFNRYMEKRKGMLKPERIEMREDLFRTLLSLSQ